MIISAISIIIFISSLLFIEAKLVLVIIMLSLIFYFFFRPIFLISKKYSFISTSTSANLQKYLVEFINNFSYLKATNRTTKIVSIVKSHIFTLIKITRLMSYLSNILSSIKEPLGVIILSSLIYYKVTLNGENISEALFIGILLYRSVQRILEFNNGLHRSNEACGGLFAVEKGLNELNKNKENDFGRYPPDFNATLEFKKVSLRYGKKKVLDDLSFKIYPKEIIGIAGPSGAGKSSIIHIITKLIRPSTGNVLLGKKNLEEVHNTSFRSGIGYVTQDPSIVQGSLNDNISFFEPSSKKKGIKNLKYFMKLAGIDNLYNRMEEDIYEAGKNYSGGQKQRIAIARELYRDPKVLIFDEPTSSLDEKSTKIIEQTINKFKGTKTIIIVSHNLKFLSVCERIILIQDGKILKQGKYSSIKKHLN